MINTRANARETPLALAQYSSLTMFPTLTERQEKILDLVIRNYIANGQPVSSKTLVSTTALAVSSATVRNELAALHQMGYLMQMHTSAGRVPTEAGYRYFVQKLLKEFHLPQIEQQAIHHQFRQERLDLNQWMRLAAATLAHVSHGASFVTAPRIRTNKFKHIQLISTQGRMALMILVLYGGEVNQQMLMLAEPLPQPQLSATADRLNSMFENGAADDMAARLPQLNVLEREVARLAIEVLRRADEYTIRNIHRDGLVNLLEDAGTRSAVRVLEERALLADVISGTEASGNEVQIVIGGNGRWQELKNCTIILSRYGVAEQVSGTVAVIGSTRMSYGRNVAAVQYISNLMSSFLREFYIDEP